MIRNIFAAAALLLVSACQTVSTGKDEFVYSGSQADEDAIVYLADAVCVQNIGNSDGMNAAAQKITGNDGKSHVAAVGGKNVPIISYRYEVDGKYLAFVSVIMKGNACSVNFSDGLVRPSAFQTKFDVTMIAGIHGGAVYGKSKAHNMVMVVSKSRGEDGTIMSVGFMNQQAYAAERAVTGAPNVEWGG